MVQPNHLDVRCESCETTVQPETPAYRRLFILAGMMILGGIGLLIGLVTGVATAGTGFVAWIFTVPIGLYAGYKTGDILAEVMDGYSCPECGHEFSAPALATRVVGFVTP